MRDTAESMGAHVLIDFHRARADESRELAGGLAALKIHLEESILGVKKSERASNVFTRGPGDRRHTERIAIDTDGCGKPAHRGGAGQLRQAGADLGAEIRPGGDDEHNHHREQDHGVFQDFPEHQGGL